VAELADRVAAGEVRAAARACRIVDDQLPGYRDLLKTLFPRTGRAWIVGVTGNPGAGKSTLVDRLISALRASDAKVAVVAVDPSSPFTGGAILGDRVRMQRHFQDPGVFIRSLATRGALGGLSRSARDVVRVLDAWGADVVLIETVGVGQDELEVVRTAHTTLVVVAPGMGDDVQAIKAGILECADVFAVNKADREGADSAARDLELMIAIGGEVQSAGAHSRSHGAGVLDLAPTEVAHADDRWVPPITKCVATKNEGIAELLSHMQKHRTWLLTSAAGTARREERARMELTAILRDGLMQMAKDALDADVHELARAVLNGEMDPYSAGELLALRFLAADAKNQASFLAGTPKKA
jgi:LAO/AO transport system kinase